MKPATGAGFELWSTWQDGFRTIFGEILDSL